MPIVQSTQTVSQAQTPGGMSWSQLIEAANKRTDRRGEKSLDLDYEMLTATLDFCNEYRWFWRRVTATVTTQANSPVYALGDPNIECEKIIKAYYIAGPNQSSQLSLLTDEDAMVNLLEGFDTPSQPGKFMREPQTWNQIRINMPDGAYKLRFLFWALPAFNMDAIGEAVPLVPPSLHPILVTGLEKRIFRFTLGEGAVKYQAAAADYGRMIIKASQNKDGVEGVVRQYVSNEPAIRSTNLGRR